MCFKGQELPKGNEKLFCDFTLEEKIHGFTRFTMDSATSHVCQLPGCRLEFKVVMENCFRR